MNIAFFVKPKSMTVYLYEDNTVARGLVRLKESGGSALPVLSREGKYKGTVSEGDFLWYLADSAHCSSPPWETEIASLLHPDRAASVPVTTAIEDLPPLAWEQSFVSVVDDSGSFVGIVERAAILGYWTARTSSAQMAPI